MFIDITAIVFGLIIGSFLSVCIYRLPIGKGWDEEYEDDESEADKGLEAPREEPEAPAPSSPAADERPITVMYPPRSYCPHCNNQLLWWHNIPVLSWVMLKGKCYFCKAPISGRYPSVELLSGFFSYLSFHMYGVTPTGALVFAFCASLIVISFIDYDYYIIPNAISLPGFGIGLAIGLLNQVAHVFEPPVASGILDSVYGVLAGAGFLFIISEGYFRLRKKEGLGMGDVKLLAMTGALFGPECALYTIFVGSLFGSLLGILLIIFFRRKMTYQLPFGPYLAFGTLLYLFSGTRALEALSGFIARLMS